MKNANGVVCVLDEAMKLSFSHFFFASFSNSIEIRSEKMMFRLNDYRSIVCLLTLMSLVVVVCGFQKRFQGASKEDIEAIVYALGELKKEMSTGFDEVNARVDSVNARVDSVSKDMSTGFDDVNSKFGGLREDVAGLTTKVDKVSFKLDTMKESYDIMIAGSQNKIEAQDKKFDSQNEKIAAHGVEMNAHIKMLQKEVDDVQDGKLDKDCWKDIPGFISNNLAFLLKK